MPLWLALLLLLGGPAGAPADELEDVLEGFEEEEEEEAVEPERVQPPTAPRSWDLDGALSAQLSYNYRRDAPDPGRVNYEGIAVARTQLSLELDLSLPHDWRARIQGKGFHDWAYAMQGRSDFRGRTLEDHETDLEFQELWVAGALHPRLDLRFGRQIVNWGRSETLRILDVLNPLDNREPGLVDIEDLRLPVTMTRLDGYFGRWQLTGIAVHETRFDKNPAFGSEFYPFSFEPPGEEIPGNGGSGTEWAAALTGVFSGWDFSLHWARYFDDQGHVALISLLPPAIVLRHARLTLVGSSANLALGNWLLKSEAAYIHGVRFFESDVPVPGFEDPRSSRYDVLVGVEYAGFTDQTLTVEVARRHLASFHRSFGLPSSFVSLLGAAPLVAQRDQVETTLRYSATFMNERLDFTFLALVVDAWARDGGFLRFAFDYELRPALNIGFGLVLYIGGELPTFSGIKNNDRLYLSAKYSF
ncbi:MAG: DUF1302 family protein [Myxococcota bacterium]